MCHCSSFTVPAAPSAKKLGRNKNVDERGYIHRRILLYFLSRQPSTPIIHKIHRYMSLSAIGTSCNGRRVHGQDRA